LHHVDPTTKVIAVSKAVSNQWAWDRIMKEAAKCIIVCSNCHRKLHAAERREEEQK
jgi:hypothetical protein